jgi:hypothetical protein
MASRLRLPSRSAEGEQAQARVRKRTTMKDVLIALVFLAMIVGPGLFSLDVFGEKKQF